MSSGILPGDGIKVIPFCTSGSSDTGKSGDNLAQQAASGTWLPGKRFNGSVSESEPAAWIEGLEQGEISGVIWIERCCFRAAPFVLLFNI